MTVKKKCENQREAEAMSRDRANYGELPGFHYENAGF